MAKSQGESKFELELRDYAMEFPEAHEDFPWGHRAIKVKGKIFVSMGQHDGVFSMSTKLPRSNKAALAMEFTSPTHYGMGKYGWVTSEFPVGERPPGDLLRAWIKESYCAVAPKKLAALMGGPVVADAPKKRLRPAGSLPLKKKRPAGAAVPRKTKRR